LPGEEPYYGQMLWCGRFSVPFFFRSHRYCTDRSKIRQGFSNSVMVAGGFNLKLWLSLARSFYMSVKTDEEFSQALEHSKTPCPTLLLKQFGLYGSTEKKAGQPEINLPPKRTMPLVRPSFAKRNLMKIKY